MVKKTGSPGSTPARIELEEVIGQCWVAFGQGTGSLGISRSGVAAGRSLFQRYASQEHIEAWDKDALPALEFVRAMGRLAAQLATAEGLTFILEKHFNTAALKVLEQAESGRSIDQCPYCR